MIRMGLLLLMLISVCSKAEAVDKNRYTSNPETVFCMDLSSIRKLQAFKDQRDKVATVRLFDNGDCAIVKPSLNLFIMQEKGNLVRVRREGQQQSLWTFRGALR